MWRRGNGEARKRGSGEARKRGDGKTGQCFCLVFTSSVFDVLPKLKHWDLHPKGTNIE